MAERRQDYCSQPTQQTPTSGLTRHASGQEHDRVEHFPRARMMHHPHAARRSNLERTTDIENRRGN